MPERVLVAMSGGVDSSVAAALLLRQGYEVVGATMRLWSDDYYEQRQCSGGCCSLDDVRDAQAVAAALGIPHYVLNFKDFFQKTVVDYFVGAYQKGITPNPCIACNRYVKFEELLRRAQGLDCDYIATGHYAKIEKNASTGRYELKRAADAHKDQTYVLYGMTQHQLSHTLLPMGGYRKEEARELAKGFGLPVFSKPDSQEICFVEDGDYASLIERYTGKTAQPGDFVDADGRVLGRHGGIWRYTVGQRKGLGISADSRLYVLRIDPDANTVVLGREGEQYGSGLTTEALNYIAIPGIEGELSAQVKIRYNASPVPATLSPLPDGRVRVTFEKPQRAVAPGQAAVFYDQDRVLGGGVISSDRMDCLRPSSCPQE